jgi:hypothetical protein
VSVETPDPETAVRDAIRHWSRLPELAEFAARGHGYTDTDGGFGVTYSGDRDDYDREVDGYSIPPGYVEVCGFWGPPGGYRILVPESFYLEILAATLERAGLVTEAARVPRAMEWDGTDRTNRG